MMFAHFETTVAEFREPNHDPEMEIASASAPAPSLASGWSFKTSRNAKHRRGNLGSGQYREQNFNSIQSVFNNERDNMQIQCHGFGRHDIFSTMRLAHNDRWSTNLATIHFSSESREPPPASIRHLTGGKRQLNEYNENLQRATKRTRANEVGQYYSIKEDTVVVAIEATSICQIDLMVRQGEFSEEVPLPYVPGCNFVGIVQCCGPEAARNCIYQGSRVAAFMKYGSNQRYISVSSDKLIPVPKQLDASEAACIISSFLPAFQSLHHGMSASNRYSPISLRNKVVFVTDGSSLEGQAVINLAYWAGAQEVVASGKFETHEQLRRMGATPVEENVDEWLPIIGGLVDVAVHLDYPNNLPAIQSTLKLEGGRLVCYSRQATKKEQPEFNWITKMELWYAEASLALLERASMYDPFASMENYPDQFQKDLAFLFLLLRRRQIRPKIEQYVSLNSVPRIHNELETSTVRNGAIICEPWKDSDM